MNTGLPPPNSVRGRIAHYLQDQKNKNRFQEVVLEIGSRFPAEEAWWVNNRHLLDGGEWIGVDIQPGINVDQVEDAHRLSFGSGSMGTVLCSEVLEHVIDPRKVVSECARVLRPGGWLIITTLFSFPIHGYPNDYWRFTPACLSQLLKEVELVDVETSTAGMVRYSLNDHGEPTQTRFNEPMHVFAVGQRPW